MPEVSPRSLPLTLRPYADLTDCDGDESAVEAIEGIYSDVLDAYRVENGWGDPCGILAHEAGGWWFAYDSLRRHSEITYPTKAAALVALDTAIMALASR